MNLTLNRPLWDDHPWVALPKLEADASCDVCVVGLGGSGLAATLEALQHGASVIAVDGNQVGSGAAGRNGGFMLAGAAKFHHQVVAEIGAAKATALYHATLAEIEHLIALTPTAIRRTGSIRLASSADELEDCAVQLATMQADGLPVESFEGQEGIGLHFPKDCAMNPLARVRLLAQIALQRGAQLFENTLVKQLESGVVRTEHYRIFAKKIIVAVDGKLEQIFPQLQSRVRTTRLQMLGTAPTAARFAKPVYARWGYEYWQQQPDGRITIGGFRDHFENNEWTLEHTPSEELQTHLEQFLRVDLGVNAQITHRWAASVSYSQTGLPILEEMQPDVWAVGAYNGTGNVMGSIYARAAVRQALGMTSSDYIVYTKAST